MKAKIEILEKDEAKVYKWGVYDVVDSTKYEWDRYPVEIVNNHLWELRKMAPAAHSGLVYATFSSFGTEPELSYIDFKRCRPFRVDIRLSNYEGGDWVDIPYASIPYDKFFAQMKYDNHLRTVLSREWLEANASHLTDWEDAYEHYEVSLLYKYKENVALLINYENPFKVYSLNKDNVQKIYNRWTPEQMTNTFGESHQPEYYITNNNRFLFPESDDYCVSEYWPSWEEYANDNGGYFQGFDYHFDFEKDGRFSDSEIRSRISAEIRRLIQNQQTIPMVRRLMGLSGYGANQEGETWLRAEDGAYYRSTNDLSYFQELLPFGWTGDDVEFSYDWSDDVQTSGTSTHMTASVTLHMEVPIYTLGSKTVINGRYDDYYGDHFGSMSAARTYSDNYYTKQQEYWDSFNYAINIHDYNYSREPDGKYGPVYGYVTSGISSIYQTNDFSVPAQYTGNHSNGRYIGYVADNELLPILYNDVIDWGREFSMDWKPDNPNHIEEETMIIETTVENFLSDNQIIQYEWDDGIVYPSLADYVGIKEVGGDINGDPVRVFSYNRNAYPISADGELYNGFLYKYIGSTATKDMGQRISEVYSTNPAAYPWNGSLISGGTRRWYVYEGLRRTVIKTFFPPSILDCSLKQSVGTSNSFSIGCVGGATANFEILKPIPEILGYKGHDCFVYFAYPNPYNKNVWQYYKEGLFTIRELEENGYNRTMITAYDNTYKLDCKAWPLLVKLSSDINLLQLFYYVCAYCDIPYATEFFFTNNDMTLGDISGWNKDITCREVITWITQMCGNVMVCDENGVLVIKELAKPVLTRGSGVSENYSLKVSMVPVIKPEAIRYKIGNSQITIGEEYSQWENRILDYSSNGLLQNHNELEDNRRLNTLLEKINDIEDIYAFDCDVDNNIYGCFCGDSWVVEGDDIPARRGIITDRTISMSGIHLTSSAGIESEYVPMAVSDIDAAIGALDSSVFRKIHIANIYYVDKYTNNVYKTIVANFDFSITNTTFAYEDTVIDLSSQFDNLFTYPNQKVEIYIGIHRAQVWIENHNLYVIESAHTSELFDGLNDVVVLHDGGTYNPSIDSINNGYRFSELYSESWDVWKDEITNEYSIPIHFTKVLADRVGDNRIVNTSITLGGFQLKEILEMGYQRILTLNRKITEDGLVYYTSWQTTIPDTNLKEDHELTLTLTDYENYAGSLVFSYNENTKILLVKYETNSINVNDDTDGVFVENQSPINMTTHNMFNNDSVVLLKVADGQFQVVSIDRTNYEVRTCPSQYPTYTGLGGHYENYGRGTDTNVIPIYNNSIYMGSICYHAQGAYNDMLPNGWTFRGEIANSANRSVKNLKYWGWGTAWKQEGGYSVYNEDSIFAQGAKWYTLAYDPNATDENYRNSQEFAKVAGVFTFDNFIQLPIIRSIVFEDYTAYGIDTANGNIGIYYNTEYFVPEGAFELMLPQAAYAIKIYLYYAPSKQLILRIGWYGGAFVDYDNGELADSIFDYDSGTLHIMGTYDVLDEILDI